MTKACLYTGVLGKDWHLVRPTSGSIDRIGPPLEFRDNDEPYIRHLEPDFEIPTDDLKDIKEILDMHRSLPLPESAPIKARWNSVVLFFNLNMPRDDLPSDRLETIFHIRNC